MHVHFTGDSQSSPPQAGKGYVFSQHKAHGQLQSCDLRQVTSPHQWPLSPGRGDVLVHVSVLQRQSGSR